MDFIEAMSICAYDVTEAAELAGRYECPRDVIKEALTEIGLEKIQPESAVTVWR